MKNWYINLSNAWGQSFPHTVDTLLCVENSDLTGSKHKFARSSSQTADWYLFAATLHFWVYIQEWQSSFLNQHASTQSGPAFGTHSFILLDMYYSMVSLQMMRSDEKWWEVMKHEKVGNGFNPNNS